MAFYMALNIKGFKVFIEVIILTVVICVIQVTMCSSEGS
jgi:hypothetical protein